MPPTATSDISHLQGTSHSLSGTPSLEPGSGSGAGCLRLLKAGWGRCLQDSIHFRREAEKLGLGADPGFLQHPFHHDPNRPPRPKDRSPVLPRGSPKPQVAGCGVVFRTQSGRPVRVGLPLPCLSPVLPLAPWHSQGSACWTLLLGPAGRLQKPRTRPSPHRDNHAPQLPFQHPAHSRPRNW